MTETMKVVTVTGMRTAKTVTTAEVVTIIIKGHDESGSDVSVLVVRRHYDTSVLKNDRPARKTE